MRLALAFVALLALPPGARATDLLAEAAGSDSAIADAVEERIRLLYAHRLAGDTAALAGDVADLESRDRARLATGRPRTGLTDDARYFAAGAAFDRDERRAGLEAVLDADPDPAIRRLAEHALESDDGATGDRLLANDRHNRRANLLNDAVRPLGVFSGTALLAAVNPILLAGSAVDSVATTAMNLWNYNRLSTPQREALARYQAQLQRDPVTRDAPEIARAVRQLGKKRAEAMCKETVLLGEQALDADDVDRALFFTRSARGLDGCENPSARLSERTAQAAARRAAAEEAGLWPADDARRPRAGLETLDYETLAAAVALGEPGGMVEAASRFRERHEDSHFVDSADYVIAVARDLGGHPADARTALAEVADGDSGVARHAQAVLDSPSYSGLDAVRTAEKEHRRAALRYVFLGGGMDGRTVLHSATHLGAAGVAAAESLGIFNVIGVATRAWKAWRKDPISNQEIIDRGEELLARSPHSADAPAVHEALAEAYERQGLWGRALMHYRSTPDPSPKRIAKLETKLADDLLKDAEKDGGNPALLETISTRFPDTKAADTARERLRDRPPGGTVVARAALEANPSLLGPTGFDLEPTLLDGDADNGELADKGVALRDGALHLWLRDRSASGEHEETRTLAPDAYARATAAAHEAVYAHVLTADRRDPETGRFERYVPFFLQGEVGEGGGVYVYPGVKMRRYQSEDAKLYE